MPRSLLRQPMFTYSACRLFTKNKKRIQKFKETGDSRYVYTNDLNKACFEHGMVYEDFKDLPRGTAARKELHDKAFKVAKSPEYDGYQRRLTSKFLLKNESAPSGPVKREIMQNQQLTKELRKLISRKFEKQKVHSSFIDNMWVDDLIDMQLIVHLITKFDFYFMLLTFLVNPRGLFL